MLDAYISKEDILKLLSETEEIGSLINKRAFQLSITKLKEHRKPKVIEIHGFKIKNKESLIWAINRYTENIRLKKNKSEAILYFEEFTKMNLSNRKYCLKEIEWGDWDEIKETREMDICDIVLSRKEIMKILNISKKTLIRYENGNIIKKFGSEVVLYVSGYKKGRCYIGYYSLKSIMENLTRCK